MEAEWMEWVQSEENLITHPWYPEIILWVQFCDQKFIPMSVMSHVTLISGFRPSARGEYVPSFIQPQTTHKVPRNTVTVLWLSTTAVPARERGSMQPLEAQRVRQNHLTWFHETGVQFCGYVQLLSLPATSVSCNIRTVIRKVPWDRGTVLRLSTTVIPASDLGFMQHKNSRLQGSTKHSHSPVVIYNFHKVPWDRDTVLRLSTTVIPASDLGFMQHKNSRELGFIQHRTVYRVPRNTVTVLRLSTTVIPASDLSFIQH
ncbi:hypothetical protein C8J56DRAFT_892460 [Mycena floridula]|nr:hypothetical protein C8J56DRAFT_892460 [Mycena floridula]